jgi:hypothetical protein
MWTIIKNQLDSKIFSLEFGNMETLEYYPLRGLAGLERLSVVITTCF